jgi:hypothetical protein
MRRRHVSRIGGAGAPFWQRALPPFEAENAVHSTAMRVVSCSAPLEESRWAIAC